MANQLDEENGPIREDGKDINVIAKQIPVKGWCPVCIPWPNL